jgi:hypothetical protein
MTMLGTWARDAFESGTALQVVLSDDEGLVLDQMGDTFVPEILVAALLGTEGAVNRIRELLKVGPMSEITMRLKIEKISIYGRFFENVEGNYLISVVVPAGSGASMLAHRIIDEFNTSRMRRS